MINRVDGVIVRDEAAGSCCEESSSRDGELLRRFVETADEDAFARLVERHGPYVLGVARRLTAHVQDAEDVFQACFLELARNAKSICRMTSVAGWLQTVAVRMARRALRRRTRRERREIAATMGKPSATPADITWRETSEILEQEIGRLSEELRSPIILCLFQGMTHEQASQTLGVKLRTLRARLGRGRELLRKRLTRRGVTLTILGAALIGGSHEAAVSMALSAVVVRGAAALLRRSSLAGIVSPAVLALIGRTPSITTWGMIGVVALGLGLCGGTALVPRTPATALGREQPASAHEARDSSSQVAQAPAPGRSLSSAAAARTQTATREPPEVQSLHERRLTKMRSFVESLTIAEVDDAAERPIQLVNEPVLRFSDPDRLHSDGTLWVWGDRGRPRAFSEVFLKDDNESVLYHGLTSTADGPLVGRKTRQTIWSPQRAGVDFEVLPDAQRPPRSSRARRAQMKRLAKRFTAYEVFPADRRSELRLLTSPVHQYEDEEAGILDGGVFVLALGTNPEVIVLLEARGADGADAGWNYAVARRGNAPLFVELDGEPVWEARVYSEGAADDVFFYSIPPIVDK